MAQWNKKTQTYRTIGNQSHDTSLHEVFIQADGYGNLITSSEANPTGTSAFNEPISIPITPVLQLDGLYGLANTAFETYNFGTGSVSANTMMNVSTGTGAYGYGVIRSRRTVRYRPGQGALARFTAKFTSGTAGYTQRAGFFSQEQALQVGFNGTEFGVLRENGGKAHIEKLTVTGTAGGAETVTITLNGTEYTVSVTAGTVEENATEIGNGTYGGWIVDYCDDTVYFLSTSVGAKAGSFSVTSTGTLTATTTTVQGGAAHNTIWTPQSNFTVDKLDGTGPSLMTLDPTKLNVYQINYRWLGAGEIRFAIENPENGDMIAFHHIHYANQFETPHLDNPSLKIGYVAADLTGSGGTDVIVSGASMMGAIEGVIQTTKYPVGAFSSQTTNKSTGSIHHMLTVKDNLITDNKINTRELLIKKLSCGANAASSAPCLVYLYLNAATAAQLEYETVDGGACKSTTETTITAGQVPIAVFNAATATPLNVDLEDLRLAIPAGSTITVGISSSAILTRTDCALTIIED